MPSPETIAGVTMIVIIGWLLWYSVASVVGRRRLLAGECVRCGRVHLDQLPNGLGNSVTMCGKCLGATRLRYRLGSWFFYGLSGFFVLSAPFVIGDEVRRFGVGSALDAAVVLVPLMVITGAAGFAIRYYEGKLR
jgi:hypothetical protein